MVLVSSDNTDPFNKKRQNLNIPKKPNKSLVKREAVVEDTQQENLRPQTLASYIGQRKLKESLGISIQAAKQRGESIDHILFYGPPGLGKTTISSIIAKEMGVEIKITSAPALERPRDIAGILTSLKPNDILFIDEIHRLNRMSEEILYPAMEDFSLDITIGKGNTARIKRIPLKKFTLIGATTKVGSLSSPLRDRFGIINRLNFYDVDELADIIERSAEILKLNVTREGAIEIGQRARGTPRIANRLLKRVRDYAQVKGNSEINKEVANSSLDLLNIDSKGLEPIDRMILNIIIENYKGGPVGIETIAAAINEDITTIEDVHEPYLLQLGFLNRTPRGRITTYQAYKHLGKML